MSSHDQGTLQTVVTGAAVGGFVSLAIAGWILAFDVSSIATLIAGATENHLLSALFIGGALTKGATAGTAFGLVLAARRRRSEREGPAIDAVPALA